MVCPNLIFRNGIKRCQLVLAGARMGSLKPILIVLVLCGCSSPRPSSAKNESTRQVANVRDSGVLQPPIDITSIPDRVPTKTDTVVAALAADTVRIIENGDTVFLL